MTTQDDLTAGVAQLLANTKTLTDNVAAHDTAVQAELQALKDALAAAGVNDPAVAQAVANIATASTSVAASAQTIATETQGLAASLPSAPTA